MKKSVIIAISAVIVLALAIGGFFMFNNASTDDTTPDANATTAPTAVADPVADAPLTVAPAPKTAEEVATAVEESKKNAYGDATEVSGFTKEQVQSVLRLSHEYSNVALTSKHFLSGDWYAAGLKMDEVDNYVGKYFDLELRKKIREIDTTSANPNVYRDVATVMFYMDKAENIGPHASCDTKAPEGGDVLCPPIVKFSKMEYVPTVLDDVNGIQVSYSTNAEMPLTQNGVTKYITVTHDVKLNFVPNKTYEPDTDPNKFVVNYYDIKLTSSQLHDVPVNNYGGE